MTTDVPGAIADALEGGVYRCDECGFCTNNVDDLDAVNDVHERVMEGEFMMSGTCPECNCGISVPDCKIPDYTLHQAVAAMRARGWIVTVEVPK